ncbi:MAG: response regulator transcription factor [candidate division NC10 bacterium]|nr:response regulator transcription factor [candidate division NC10 bacterium]
MPPIQVFIAENNPEFRELLRQQLRLAPDLEVIGEAPDGRQTIAAAGRLAPDVITLDLDLPGMTGLEVLQVVRWCSPKTKIIILSRHEREETILEALNQGAMGYIVKGEEINLAKAIRAVHQGEMWVKRRVLSRAIEDLVRLANLTFPATGGEPALA